MFFRNRQTILPVRKEPEFIIMIYKGFSIMANKKEYKSIWKKYLLLVLFLLILPAGVCHAQESDLDFVETLADPELWKEIPESGTVEVVRYPTHYYFGENGNASKKEMSIYTPYGYDRESQYDVLILIPGMDMSSNCYLNKEHHYESGGTGCVCLKNLFDNAIAEGRIKPMIVANISYFGTTGSGSPVMSLDANNVAKELRYDILPYLAENYATYAADGSQEAISQQRDHFGVFGFSYSSTMIPRTILPECMDLFSWFGASSVFCENITAGLNQINRKISDYPVRFFYWGCGDEDAAHDQTIQMYDLFTSEAEGFERGVNTDLVILPDTGHDAKTYDTAIYNCAQTFFQEAKYRDLPEEGQTAEKEETGNVFPREETGSVEENRNIQDKSNFNDTDG